jgi:hypothetical protein
MPVHAAPVLSLRELLAAQPFAIVFDAAYGKLCAGTSTICEKTFGLCSSPGAMLRVLVIARWKMSGCVWQNALLSYRSDGRIASLFHSALPIHTVAAPLLARRTRVGLSIHTKLFGVFFGSN